MRLEIGEWLPDLPEHENPGAIQAKNVIAQLQSYRSLRGLASFTSALGGACLGSFWARSTADVLFNFAGDQDNLYKLASSGVAWDEISKTTDVYTASNWDFAQFGNRIIGVNIADAPQYFDMGTSSAFADLPGSPPNASNIAVVRDFLVLGDIDDGTRQTRTVKWSGFNNSEAWDISQVTQSDEQELKGRGGVIRRVVPGDVGTIFQERSISRMTYVGPPIVFRVDEVERARGATGQNSIAWTGAYAYFHSADGFYRFDLHGGAEAEPIGSNRINRWFAANADPTEIVNMRAAVDRINSLVLWAFKSSSSATVNDRLLIYNWQANRWSHAEIEIQSLSEFATTGLNLDQLDTPLPLGIDLDSISVDSTAFSGGVLNLLAFDSSNQAATFQGNVLEACIDTKEFSDAAGLITYYNGVRPLVETDSGQGGTVRVQPLTRNRLIDNPVANNPSVGVNAIGQADLRETARYHRFRLTTSTEFKHATGVEFKPRPRGRR